MSWCLVKTKNALRYVYRRIYEAVRALASFGFSGQSDAFVFPGLSSLCQAVKDFSHKKTADRLRCPRNGLLLMFSSDFRRAPDSAAATIKWSRDV